MLSSLTTNWNFYFNYLLSFCPHLPMYLHIIIPRDAICLSQKNKNFESYYVKGITTLAILSSLYIWFTDDQKMSSIFLLFPFVPSDQIFLTKPDAGGLPADRGPGSFVVATNLPVAVWCHSPRSHRDLITALVNNTHGQFCHVITWPHLALYRRMFNNIFILRLWLYLYDDLDDNMATQWYHCQWKTVTWLGYWFINFFSCVFPSMPPETPSIFFYFQELCLHFKIHIITSTCFLLWKSVLQWMPQKVRYHVLLKDLQLEESNVIILLIYNLL